MTATLKTTIIQEPSSATANITLDTSGDVTIGQNLTVAGSVIGDAGTSSLPAVTASGDLNTGIFFPAADTIAFTNGGTEELRIGPAGQIGIAGENYGTSGQVLTSGGASASPSWATPSSTPSGMTLLGTITTTSGTSLTLTDLTLTDYKYLYLAVNGVSSTTATDDLRVVSGAGTSIAIFLDSNNAAREWNGTIIVNLENGSIGGWGTNNGSTSYGISPTSAGAGAAGTKFGFGRINQTTASTSIGVSVQTAFDAGTVKVYGVS